MIQGYDMVTFCSYSLPGPIIWLTSTMVGLAMLCLVCVVYCTPMTYPAPSASKDIVRLFKNDLNSTVVEHSKIGKAYFFSLVLI